MELLVSVRSVPEAQAALAGGAGLIDVKEPERGSLGRAAAVTIRAVANSVAGRRPVSAALGELIDDPVPCAVAGLAYAKWGLAGCAAQSDWQQRLAGAGRRLQQQGPGCRPVAVAYADWQRAHAPSPPEVFAFALLHGWDTFLLDTWHKDGSTLLDWLSLSDVSALRRRCHQANIRVALAGSIGLAQLRVLSAAAPDWFAVRGAACRDGRRDAEVDERAVRRLVEALECPEALNRVARAES